MGDNILKKHVGARNELAATVWLLENGYEVFRNVSPFGIVDIVAMKDGKIFKFDVKTPCISKDGRLSPSSMKLSTEQIANDVMRLNVYPDMHCEIVRETIEVKIGDPAICQHCSNVFFTGRKTTFCSRKCGNSFHVKRLKDIREGKRQGVVQLHSNGRKNSGFRNSKWE